VLTYVKQCSSIAATRKSAVMRVPVAEATSEGSELYEELGNS
jgi:hypothetical protein